MNTKGKPFHVTLTPGQRHESTVAREMVEAARGKALLGDSGYDANATIEAVRAKGMKAVINPNPTRKWHLVKLDRKLYKKRYLVEVFFHNLKRFRAVATRYDKTARNFLAMVHVACAFLLLN